MKTVAPHGKVVAEENHIGESASASIGTEDWQGLFLTIPAPLREMLEDALLRADMEDIEQLMVQIAKHAPGLAVKLRELAHEFEYQTILSLMKGLSKE